MKWNLDGADLIPSLWLLPIQKNSENYALHSLCGRSAVAILRTVVQVCTLTPNICWSWIRSRKDWNMQKFCNCCEKSCNPLKSEVKILTRPWQITVPRHSKSISRRRTSLPQPCCRPPWAAQVKMWSCIRKMPSLCPDLLYLVSDISRCQESITFTAPSK